MTQESVALYQASWPVALGAAYLAFFVMGVYRSIWRFTGLVDLARYALAAGSAGLLAWVFLRLLPLGGFDYPDSVFALFALYLFLAVAATRASFALLDRLRVILAPRRQPDLTNVLIYGVPTGGRLAEAWLQDQIIGGETGALFHAIGFLDEDPRLWQREVHGLQVLGGGAQAEQILATQPVQGVVVMAAENLETPAGLKLIEVCSQHGVWLRTLKVVLEDVE
jgi:FlaA1/EpsC-like NDP-sugar epimerase